MAIRATKKIPLIQALAVFFSLMLTDTAWANAFTDPGEGMVGFANLIPVQKEINAGVTTIGSTSFVVVLFKNNGAQTVTVESLNLYPSSNVAAEVSLNQCSLEPLPPYAECAITMAITPLMVGEWRLEILVNHSGQSRLAIASLVGQVKRSEQEAANIQLDVQAIPEILDFGKLQDNVTLTRSISYYNKTSRVIDVYRLKIEAPKQAGFELISDCAELAPGQKCVATVKWKPQIRGDAKGVIVFEHSGVSRINRVEVNGKYLPIQQNEFNQLPQGAPGRGSADETAIVNSQAAIRTRDAMVMTSQNKVSTATVASQLDIDDMEGEVKTSALLPDAASQKTLTEKPVKERTRLSLDDFTISSLSKQKAVIRGPNGSLVVRHNQEHVFIAGVSWKVKIETFGVRLFTKNKESIIFFDPFLRSTHKGLPAMDKANLGGANNANTATSKAMTPTAMTAPKSQDTDISIPPIGEGI